MLVSIIACILLDFYNFSCSNCTKKGLFTCQQSMRRAQSVTIFDDLAVTFGQFFR